MQLFIALFYIIGKIFSNVGQTIFGTIVWIAYFVSSGSKTFNRTSKAVVPITATANMIIVFASRFPSLNDQDVNRVNNVAEVTDISRKQKAVIRCLQGSGIVYGVINILNGSIGGGAALIRYPLSYVSNSYIRTIVSISFIGYIAICYSKTFCAYNFKKISSNAEKCVAVLSNQSITDTIRQMVFMNKKTLVTCIAGTISYLGFTYIMTKQLFRTIPGLNVNTTFVQCVSLAALFPVFIAQILSVIVSTREYFDEDNRTFAEVPYSHVQKLVIGLICIMAFIEVTSTGLGNFVGTTELLQDFLSVDPYSWLACILSGIAGVSSAFQEYTFNALTGIKNVADLFVSSSQLLVNEETSLITRQTTVRTSYPAKLLNCCGLFSFKSKQCLIKNEVTQESKNNSAYEQITHI